MNSFRHFPLRIVLQSLFISTFAILVGIIIYLSSYEYSKSIAIFSKKLMAGSATSVMLHLQSEINPAQILINISQSLMENHMVHPDEMIDYTYYVAKNLHHYTSKVKTRVAGWGDTQGNSIETLLEADGTFSTVILKPYAKPPIGIKLYRDHNGEIIKRENIKQNFDPRIQPWYIAAQNYKQGQPAIWTEIFLSYPYKNSTIATAFPVYNAQNILQGVFEIELKFLGLSNFLLSTEITPNSEALVLNNKNELIGFAGMTKEFANKSVDAKIESLITSGKGFVVDSLKLYDKNPNEYFRFISNGNTYLAYFKPIPNIGYSGVKVGFIAPENDFTGDLKRANAYIIIASLVIIIFGALIIKLVSGRISRSLNLLVKDTQRIKDFHLDNNHIKSYISEIVFLNNSMESMKSSLRAFKKFVPTNLVRQLIRKGEGVGISGDSKNITICFTDIVNFTSISEKMEPKDLLSQLGEYFEELTNIISKEQGTIDKYIGDSIMAFWGAPITDKKHCFHACTAALKFKESLEKLNDNWKKQKKPQLITAIGIHTGNAIVGNIGSSTRLNYTVMGDNINFTSRLVSQSKIYGAKIIVSEDVVNSVKKQFIFRFIDKVEVHGKAGVYTIYELVGKV